MPVKHFSGTREGLTHTQRQALTAVMASYRADGFTVFHHGDCVGADAEAHAIARRLGFSNEGGRWR